MPDIPEAQTYPNKLLYHDSITNLGTFLRYYVPEITNTANVPLPEIEAFDILTGKTLETPEPLEVDFTKFADFINTYSKIIDLTYLLHKPTILIFFITIILVRIIFLLFLLPFVPCILIPVCIL